MALKNGRTTAALQTILVGSVIPSGTISPFGGGTVPSGWLLCDGTAVSRTTYASLYAAILVANGYGDNATTFNLPDLRGRFLRGVDGAAGNDPDVAGRTAAATGGNTGNTVGSVQTDAHQNITGGTGQRVMGLASSTGALVTTSVAGSLYGGGGGTGAILSFDASLSPSQRTSTETRPKNANVNYIIKV